MRTPMYVYPTDPVNDFDLDGNAGWSWKSAISIVTKVANVGSFIPGPIGMACAAVAVAGNVAQGHYAEAAIAATGLLGAGALTKIAAKAIDAGKAGSALRGVGAVASRLAKVQSRMPGIGANSRLFGNMKWGSRMGILNNKFSSVKIGWSHYMTTKGAPVRRTFRVGYKGKHFDLLVGGAW